MDTAYGSSDKFNKFKKYIKIHPKLKIDIMIDFTDRNKIIHFFIVSIMDLIDS